MSIKFYSKVMSASALIIVPVFASAAFTDVPSSNVHLEAITKLQTEGIMTGHDDGMFRPNATINRAELTKIVVESQFSAADIAACDVKAMTFTDIESTDWFAKYVCVAKANNVIDGYADGTFKPATTVNFAEATKIVVMSMKPSVFAATSVAQGSPWYAGYIAALNSYNGQPTSTIQPASSLTRAEAAEMVYRTKFKSDAGMMMDDKKDMEDEMANQNLGTIVDIAVATESTSTLVAAVTAADLVATLQGAGPFTVFAPVNSAFAALPAGTVESLLLPENKAQLQSVLTYHVVAGAVRAGDLSDGQIVKTVQGENLVVSIAADGVVRINNAIVTTANVEASNGVIHLIDSVLLPDTNEDSMMKSGEYTTYTDGVIGNGKESVLFFHAAWCPKCRANDASLTSWYSANEYGRTVYKLDYDSNTELRKQFGVTSQDTFVAIDGEGNAMQKITFPSESDLEAILN